MDGKLVSLTESLLLLSPTLSKPKWEASMNCGNDGMDLTIVPTQHTCDSKMINLP